MGSLHLEVVAGKAAGMSIFVHDELLVGRLAEGAGRLADDEDISRSHARFTVDEDGLCAIEDLNSMNGTFVNGMRITSPRTLNAGDMVELGATTLVVRELPSSASAVAPATTDRRSVALPIDEPPAAPPIPAGAAEPDESPTADEPGPPSTPAESDQRSLTGDRPDEPAPVGPRELAFRVVVELSVVVDPDRGAAQIAVGNGSGRVDLVFADGAWQLEPSA